MEKDIFEFITMSLDDLSIIFFVKRLVFLCCVYILLQFEVQNITLRYFLYLDVAEKNPQNQAAMVVGPTKIILDRASRAYHSKKENSLPKQDF